MVPAQLAHNLVQLLNPAEFLLPEFGVSQNHAQAKPLKRQVKLIQRRQMLVGDLTGLA